VGFELVSERPQKYSKRRIAEIQIFRAIKVLVDDHDPISAVTLAGAAEEILGKKLKSLGKRNALDHSITYDEQMWAFIKKHSARKGVTVSVPDQDAMLRKANFVRNELKHNGANRPVVALYEYEAENMIIRAVNNYLLLYQKPPPQKRVIAWYEQMSL
jgi:hypothetical protein